MKIVLIFLLIASFLRAATYQMTTAEKSEFDTVYSGTVAGDTIVFPLNGSATWSASATIGRPLTIDGNGTTLTQGSTLNTGFFYVTGFTSASLMRITGFVMNAVDFTSARACVVIGGPGGVSLTNLRIDHNTFHYGYSPIICYGAKGVIDHNTIYNSLKGIDFSAGSVAQANASWDSMAAGTGDALFIENNSFIDNANYPSVSYGQEKIGTENGGKLVVRANIFNADNVNVTMTDPFTPIHTHGSAAGGSINGYWEYDYGNSGQGRRGQSVVEVYQNTASARRLDYFLTLRGSANLVWGNTAYSNTAFSDTPGILLREEEGYQSPVGVPAWNPGTTYNQDDTAYVIEAGPVTRYYISKSTQSNHQPPNATYWTPYQWNPPRTTVWPAEDQVHNTFFWSNSLTRSGGGTGSILVSTSDTSSSFIQQDRDYFLHAPAATGGSESFTGLNGASGATPTNGAIYPSYGTMVFTPSGPNAYYGYSPYQYPHPLTVPPPTLGVKPARSVAGMSF